MKLYYDLHLHSALSPCGDDEMTPGNIVGMAALCGLEIVALSDHNTCRNCPAFLHHGEEAGLLVLPGMELTTSEEVHVLCLFPDLPSAMAFDEYVYSCLPPMTNREKIFGAQRIFNEHDEEVGREERLLISATSIGIYDAAELVGSYGGLALPAHIDRDSFSLLSNLGVYDEGMGFTVAEVTATASPNVLPNVPKIVNSDSHRLESIPDARFALEIREKSPRGVLDALGKL